MGKKAYVIQLIGGLMPRWTNNKLMPTTDKRQAVIYETEDEAIADFVRIGNTGFHWPFAEVKEITRRN